MEINDLNSENIFDKLKQYLEDSSMDSFHILEEEIDINEQMAYFDFSKDYKENVNEEEVVAHMDNLFSATATIDDKKVLLVKLASVNKVEAFRAIERYCKMPDQELSNWAKLAWHESRMLLESKLLDQNQIFISTGLGGKADKLRYFFVIFPTGLPFTDLQQKIIEKEFQYILLKNESVVEELVFHEKFATLMVLIPITTSIKPIFMEALEECNQLGEFIKSDFIVTNVKRLNEEEIIAIASKQQNETEDPLDLPDIDSN